MKAPASDDAHSCVRVNVGGHNTKDGWVGRQHTWLGCHVSHTHTCSPMRMIPKSGRQSSSFLLGQVKVNTNESGTDSLDAEGRDGRGMKAGGGGKVTHVYACGVGIRTGLTWCGRAVLSPHQLHEYNSTKPAISLRLVLTMA